MKRLGKHYYRLMYYASWLVFGLVGLGLNVACAVLLPLPRTPWLQKRTRASIGQLFRLWSRWLHATGIVRVRWIGFPDVLRTGTVYIANHPTLVDATMLLCRLPDTFCIFKPALMRNPCIAPAAIMAGYEVGNRHVDTLRAAAAKVASGQSLLVFPEGTRTAPGTPLGRIKPGFALLARRAHAPVQLLLIRSSPGLVTRCRPWWKLPEVLPGSIDITYDRCWEDSPGQRPGEFSSQVEQYMLSRLPGPVE